MYRLIYIVLACLMFLTSIQETRAQVRRIQNTDRLGDTLVLVDLSKEKERIKRPKVINKEIVFGPMIYTGGYGINVGFGWAFGEESFGVNNADKYYHSHFIQLEAKERIHPKEDIKLLRGGLLGGSNPNSKSYIYGKVNTVYTASLMYGQRRLLGGRGELHSPLIQYVVSIGPTISLVKPYYLILSNGDTISYNEENPFNFLVEENISGKAPFSKGLDELEIVPGIAFKGGIHFDMSKKRNRKSAIEVGVYADYYFNPILQMAESEAKKLFPGLYLQYNYGFRW